MAGLLAGGVLEFVAEPADQAALFFLGPLGVERDQAAEDFFVGEVMGPAIGVGDGGVEVVVDLPQHRHQPLLVNVLHVGDRQAGMQCLLPLAVGIASTSTSRAMFLTMR